MGAPPATVLSRHARPATVLSPGSVRSPSAVVSACTNDAINSNLFEQAKPVRPTFQPIPKAHDVEFGKKGANSGWRPGVGACRVRYGRPVSARVAGPVDSPITRTNGRGVRVAASDIRREHVPKPIAYRYRTDG